MLPVEGTVAIVFVEVVVVVGEVEGVFVIVWIVMKC